MQRSIGIGDMTGGSNRRLFRHTSIFVGGFLALCILNILNSAYSTVLSLIKEELALTYTLSGALMSSYFVGYTMGQIPWGYLADRFGSRRTITLSTIGIASSTMLFGLSTSVWQAIASRFLSGLLGAGIFVPSVRLVSSWFSPGERGTALGLLSIGGSIGLIAASWVVPFFGSRLGWRGPIVILGLIGILTSAVIWSTLRDRKDWTSPAEHRQGGAGFLRSGTFWVLALTQFIRLGSNYTFIAWLPLLLQEEFGLSLLSAGVALSLFNFAGMLSNPFGGFVSDRVGEKEVLFISFSVIALDVLLFARLRSFTLIFVAIFILGWFINFIRSPSFTIIPKLYGVDVAGQLSGIHNTFASLGALALPLFLGYVRDVTDSYWMGWTALSALLMLGSMITFFLKTGS